MRQIDVILGYIPWAFAVIGLIVFILGILMMLSQKEGAGRNMINGILLVAIGVGLNWAIPWVMGMLR